MFANQYEEHLASQPDNSCWDGFDRGDDGREDKYDVYRTIVKQATNARGAVITLARFSFDRDADLWEVSVDGDVVAINTTEEGARVVARRLYCNA